MENKTKNEYLWHPGVTPQRSSSWRSQRVTGLGCQLGALYIPTHRIIGTIFSLRSHVVVTWPVPSHYLNQCWKKIETWGTNFNKIFITIQQFSYKKMCLNMSSGKWRPFCLGIHVLKVNQNACSIIRFWEHIWWFYIGQMQFAVFMQSLAGINIVAGGFRHEIIKLWKISVFEIIRNAFMSL